MDQLVDLYILDQRKLRLTKAVLVNKGCLVINEFTLQRRLQQPIGHGTIASSNGAEIRGERWANALSVDFGANDLEIDQQSLFIVDDLGLPGSDFQILGITLTFIANQYGEVIGHRDLHVLGEGVIGEDIALMEIIEIELRLGIHRDRRGQQWHRDGRAVLQIRKGATNTVLRGGFRSCEIGWNEGPLGAAETFILGCGGIIARQHPSTIHACDIAQDWAGDTEQIVDDIAVDIGDTEIDNDLLQ